LTVSENLLYFVAGNKISRVQNPGENKIFWFHFKTFSFEQKRFKKKEFVQTSCHKLQNGSFEEEKSN